MKEWFSRNWAFIVAVIIVAVVAVVVVASPNHSAMGWDKPLSQITVGDTMLLVFVASFLFRRD